MKQLTKIVSTLFLFSLLMATNPVIGQTADNTTTERRDVDNDDDDSGKWGLAGLLGLLGLLGLRRKDVEVHRRPEVTRK
jgi:MYXO-CTERM domain-containing protein